MDSNNKRGTNDKFGDMNFSDSWKTKSVELAATGAIVLGAGSLAMKGNMGDSVKYGKQSLMQAGRGFENYIKRRSNPVTRLVYNTSKKTVKNVSRAKKINGRDVMENEWNIPRHTIKDIKQDDVVAEASKRQSVIENQRKHLAEIAKETGEEIPVFDKIDPIRLQEEARADLFEDLLKPTSNGGFTKRDAVSGEKGTRTSTFVGGALSGLGFGAGITAIHAANNATIEEKNKTYEAAGSFMRDKERRGNQMDKRASLRRIHKGGTNVLGKIPTAAATGVGFTGVSLGTAAALKKKKEQEAEANKKSRIIIEFGEDELDSNDVGSHTNMGARSLLPRPDLNKTAKVKKYFKNLGGRGTELDTLSDKLKHKDYQSAASDSLKGQDVNQLAKKRYGHILPDEKAREKLLEEQTNKLRNADVNAQRAIKDDVIKAQVYTGGGLGVAGLGAGGLALLNKSKEDKKS